MSQHTLPPCPCSSGLPSVALRLFNVYGPRTRTSGAYGAVFGVFLAQKLAGKPFTVVGDGTQTRDFTYVTDVARALSRTYDIFGMSYAEPVAEETILGPYWPAYLFARDWGTDVPIQMPIVGGAAGYGAGSHANNEFFVIEGAGKVYGYAGAEKSVATVLYNYAGAN